MVVLMLLSAGDRIAAWCFFTCLSSVNSNFSDQYVRRRGSKFTIRWSESETLTFPAVRRWTAQFHVQSSFFFFPITDESNVGQTGSL